MKPINEYTLQECLEEVKRLEAEFLEYGCDDAPLASRIHEIWQVEQEGVVAISEAYQRLKDSFRWVPFKERQPIGSDGKLILVYDKYRGVYEIEQRQIRDYNPTHWRRIDTPEGV
jgi:hypothetical protein